MVKKISDTFYPDIGRIILIAGNLNTHNISSFYEAFSPKIAYDLSQKFEFHYTPLHGSWLNIAECELSSLAVQALGKTRVNSVDMLNEILFAWQNDRNFRQKALIGNLPLMMPELSSIAFILSLFLDKLAFDILLNFTRQ